jgi:hypothetical protein
LGGANSSLAGGHVSGRLSRLSTCKEPIGSLRLKSWHLLAEYYYSTTLDPLLRRVGQSKQCPSRPQPANQSQAPTTRAQHKIRALYSLRHHCSHLAHREWFYESPEAPFTRQTDPRHLENWIALNEARILSQVTRHQQHTRTGQRTIEEYFSPIT